MFAPNSWSEAALGGIGDLIEFLHLNLIQLSRLLVEEVRTQPKEKTVQNQSNNSPELAGDHAVGHTLPWNPITPSDSLLLSGAAATMAILIVYAKFAAFQSIIAGI